MTESDADGWFAGVSPDDTDAGARAIREGSADAPADWPGEAVESGFAEDESDYYAKLRSASIRATREAVTERERADDQQLVHAVRAMDDCESEANELAERVAEWAGTLYADAGTGIDYATELAETDPETPVEEQVVSLARRVADLADERDDLRSFVERQAPAVAPNLADLAGPVLAARLIALAGGLESLAKMPGGTVQVLGAENALFAHLRGHASSPKHGIIYTHEDVRKTPPAERGSAARTLSGKLVIGARIDHYSGEHNPKLKEELDRRMETIQSRGEDE
ncbi:rRNA biogenesis protein Nop56/Nop58 [Haladaptatus litoreus]|uniref:rRNA biogenesis protein Nop56/Nop58 n=1 Tax=Haladaptatus litoreus TaxID=553468 RepID=A0A1N6XW49_9EURY|nr:NOP5/NOP56 family protein [Haladaptatus litoreus]SIR06577.1 rRNA biogenesis protein Nop56/Nop58 [Haladaptatus litoreus]